MHRYNSLEDIPSGAYDVIYADPPWTYKDKASAGKRGASYKYDLMSLEDICGLDVSQKCEKDATLFMWATWPLLKDALAVMDAWGFEYKTCAFLWVKTNPKSGTPFMGMGNWTRSNTEPCLLGVKGSPKRVSASVMQPVISPRLRHSEKPSEVRSRIETLMGPGAKKLELFSRHIVPGWDSFGNQVLQNE